MDRKTILELERLYGFKATQEAQRLGGQSNENYLLITNKGKVIINGELTPIVGRICMDQCMVDISNHSRNVKVGDEVVLFGKQKGTEITIEDVAKSIGTVNYEVICIIGRRIPRVYLQNEKIYCVLNYLV